jgi:hypothetical protein
VTEESPSTLPAGVSSTSSKSSDDENDRIGWILFLLVDDEDDDFVIGAAFLLPDAGGFATDMASRKTRSGFTGGGESYYRS